jgi:hypothetical protein
MRFGPSSKRSALGKANHCLEVKNEQERKKQGRLKNNISPNRELFIENHNM